MLTATQSPLLQRPLDPDLIFMYGEAEDLVGCPHQTLRLLVVQGKLTCHKEQVADSTGRPRERAFLSKRELLSLFVPQPQPGQPILADGERWWLCSDVVFYDQHNRKIRLNPDREPPKREFFVIGPRACGLSKSRSAWKCADLDAIFAGKEDPRTDGDKGHWAIKQSLPKRANLLASLPWAEGKWLNEFIFRTTDGLYCVSWRYLLDTYPGIGLATWREWLVIRPNPDLGQKLKGFRVYGYPTVTDVHGRKITAVWLQSDADLSGRLRTDINLRKTPPGLSGKWIGTTSAVWQDDEYGMCMPDKKLRGVFGKSKNFFSNHRQHPHSALNPNINGGKPRWRAVPTPVGGKLIVTSVDDCQRIVDWADEQSALDAVAPADWKGWKDIVAVLGITKPQQALFGIALKRFRKECPDKCCRAWTGQRHKGQVQPPLHYDVQDFIRWRNGRTLEEIAAPFRRKGIRKLPRAVLFVQFVLTEGSFNRRRFKRFAAAPPTRELKPCAPVLYETLKSCAKEAGIGVTLLRLARKKAGVKYDRKVFGAQRKCYCYLPGPIIITPLAHGNAAQRPERLGIQEEPQRAGPSDDVAPTAAKPERNGEILKPRGAENTRPTEQVVDQELAKLGSRKKMGRPSGKTKEVEEREARMIQAWREKRFLRVADLARAFNVQRSYASKVLKDAGVKA